jgi:hypothetical protein
MAVRGGKERTKPILTGFPIFAAFPVLLDPVGWEIARSGRGKFRAPYAESR